jgi:hypothetical protein
MSKCQARKFLAGGRCGGTSAPGTKEDTQGVQASFSQLLAQREAMDAKMWAAPTKEEERKGTPPFGEPKGSLTQTQTTTLAVLKQEVLSNQQQRKADIDFVLEGDF